MIELAELENDFKFSVLEITKQIRDVQKYIARPDQSLIDKIANRDDYIDNLKGRIEDTCFVCVAACAGKKNTTHIVNQARAINIIAGNLERIGDYSVSIVGQLQYLSASAVLEAYDVNGAFRDILNALSIVEKALLQRDISLAMQICHTEVELDALYDVTLKRVIREIHEQACVQDRITLLFIFSYLERMGDALLNIGEAVIFASLGQKLKVHQYQALEQSLAASGMRASMDQMVFESIWGTRSGCRIGRLSGRHPEDAQRVIFKKGTHQKIIREKDNIEQWEKIYPGLPPRIVSFQKSGRHSTLLVEYLGNTTLQYIIFNGVEAVFADSIARLQNALLLIWAGTRQEGRTNAGYSRQLAARLQDVLAAHPGFHVPRKQIGSLFVSSLDEQLKKVREIDRRLSAPFGVYTHGDFNIDNIIYNEQTGLIHFIDLHRSAYGDYVQDISVFLVSNFRQPVFDTQLRARLNTVIRTLYRFARDFAAREGDTVFDARLTLAVARSLITSTRFEMSEQFAENMFLRSVYLLDRLTGHGSTDWESFELPLDALMY